MAEGMLTTIGVVKEDDEGEKVLTLAGKQAFLEAVREKLTQPVGTCVGIPVGIINFLASEYIADNFYNPSVETYDQNKSRNSGWHATWIPVYEKPVVKIFDMESAQVLKKIGIWPGDPTEAIALVLNEIKGAIEEFVGNVKAFFKKYIQPIVSSMQKLVPILLKFPIDADEAIKELIAYLAEIFEPEGEEIVNKIENAIEDKKDQLIEKIIELIAGLPTLPLPLEIPTLETIFKWLGIEFEPPIEAEVQIPSLLFPGLFPIAPPGFVMILLRTIVVMIEEIAKIIAGVSSLFKPAIILRDYILKADFIGLIEHLIGGFVALMMEKIREFCPQIDVMVVFLCSMLAYLEKMIQLIVLITIGHLIGPGLILQSIADLMGIS